MSVEKKSHPPPTKPLGISRTFLACFSHHISSFAPLWSNVQQKQLEAENGFDLQSRNISILLLGKAWQWDPMVEGTSSCHGREKSWGRWSSRTGCDLPRPASSDKLQPSKALTPKCSTAPQNHTRVQSVNLQRTVYTTTLLISLTLKSWWSTWSEV